MTAELITAASLLLGAIATAVWSGWRTRADVERIRAETTAILHELKPNSGGSTRDVVDRVEGAGLENAAALTTLQNSVDRIGFRQDDLARDVGGIRADIRHLAETDRLLAEADREDRERAAREHQSLWDAIKQRIGGDPS